MSDLDTMRAMLKRAGINFSEDEGRIMSEPYEGDKSQPLDVHIYVEVDEQDDAHQHGYPGFMADLVFTADGGLRLIGAWE